MGCVMDRFRSYNNEVHYHPSEYASQACTHCVVAALVSAAGCYKRNPEVKPFVRTAQPSEYLKSEELPKEYDPCVLSACDEA